MGDGGSGVGSSHWWVSSSSVDEFVTWWRHDERIDRLVFRHFWRYRKPSSNEGSFSSNKCPISRNPPRTKRKRIAVVATRYFILPSFSSGSSLPVRIFPLFLLLVLLLLSGEILNSFIGTSFDDEPTFVGRSLASSTTRALRRIRRVEDGCFWPSIVLWDKVDLARIYNEIDMTNHRCLSFDLFNGRFTALGVVRTSALE